MISYSFPPGIRFSEVTLNTVPHKRETPVGILNSNNNYFGADSYNRRIKFYVSVNFFVLIDYLVILSFSEVVATKLSFDYSFLSLGDY